MADDGSSHLVRVTLKGKDNETYHGTLVLKNLSMVFGHSPPNRTPQPVGNMTTSGSEIGSPGHPADPTGASYYVIAVVLVYGMSIVMLIASHIKRKHTKQVEDKQIHKYLREFQIVKERSSRDSYKTLKKSIMAKLNMANRNPTYRTLSHAILPMMAVGLPQTAEDGSPQQEFESVRTLRRASFQVSAFRPVHQPVSARGRRMSELDITLRNFQSRFGPRLGSRSREDLDLERQGSFRTFHSSSEHPLPFRIEEEIPPSPPTAATTVVDIEDHSTRRDSISSAHSVTGESELNDRYYYKPISISKDCRVYEMPKGGDPTKILKHGFHIPLFKPSDKQQTTVVEKDGLPEIIDRNSPGRSDCLSNLKPSTSSDNPLESHKSVVNRMDKESGAQDNIKVNKESEENRGSEWEANSNLSGVSHSDLGKPVQSRTNDNRPPTDYDRVTDGTRPRLPGRRFSDMGPIDHGSNARPINTQVTSHLMSPQTNSTDQDCGQVWHKRPKPSGVPRKPPLYLDVAVSVHNEWTNQPTSTTSIHRQKSPMQSHGEPDSSTNEAKTCTPNSSGSSSKKDTPSTTDTRSTGIPFTGSYDSFASGNSSDSEDVWLTMGRRHHAGKQPLPMESSTVTNGAVDESNIYYRSLYSDLALRGAGTSPLIAPRDDPLLRRLDSTDSSTAAKERRASSKSCSSRSVSPTEHESDTDKLLHQVTSL